MVKTLVPIEAQNSWQIDVHPSKNAIAIDPPPYENIPLRLGTYEQRMSHIITYKSWLMVNAITIYVPYQ